jgi:hypothetical protein
VGSVLGTSTGVPLTDGDAAALDRVGAVRVDGRDHQRVYRVAVTLSRIRTCGDSEHYYTRIKTRFLSAVPREVRRQAKPPGTASCLRALPGA